MLSGMISSSFLSNFLFFSKASDFSLWRLKAGNIIRFYNDSIRFYLISSLRSSTFLFWMSMMSRAANDDWIHLNYSLSRLFILSTHLPRISKPKASGALSISYFHRIIWWWLFRCRFPNSEGGWVFSFGASARFCCLESAVTLKTPTKASDFYAAD